MYGVFVARANREVEYLHIVTGEYIGPNQQGE
jgi:hypothetical protein